MIFFAIIFAGLCVAYANGANDNFKGVATLFGSGTTSFRTALIWATGTTFLGSLTAYLLAGNLIQSFSGKGLVDDTIATQPAFAAAVALGAGLTVLLATWGGMPISTTHSLVGALLGTGLFAGSALDMGILGSKFLLPLILSPILAIAAASVIYPVFRWSRLRLGIGREHCLCIGNATVEVLADNHHAVALQRAEKLSATLGNTVTCQSRYQGAVMGISAAETLDRLHFLSAGMVSFARGLNDTPKIAAMLLVAPFLGVSASLVLVGTVIAIGGLLSARRVAETMSHKITSMNHGQGFTANLVAGAIVIGASRYGLPVSTTHVSCGSLFGIGATTGQAQKTTILKILLAWFVTLPAAALLAGVSYWFLAQL
ncbi:inorganic phosphate transporter [Adhaeretor mobilis]|uniref:Phosphate transporter n=1 Tax=Adhaeretor mobilis TaxID=1930276 RepID=A0A517N156_9BACT|nr:inorganic phosphate transporter [Adhaeretor mobilis]QDT00748.1 Low-affinity inorganic phosphate transporter 1 [Adhaeretor mobilis]